MSKRRAIKILNAHGGSWTSRSQALKFLASGRARYVDEFTIRMIEDDPRHLAADPGRQNLELVSAHSPSLQVVEAPKVVEIHDAMAGQTFLHYPQRDQTSGRRLRRAA